MLDKVFNVLDSFFYFVRRHCGAFYWICWAYIVTLIVLQTVFEFSETITAVAVIPINFLTWPVFLETRKLKGLSLPVKRTIWALPTISTLLPLGLFLDLL